MVGYVLMILSFCVSVSVSVCVNDHATQFPSSNGFMHACMHWC